MNWRPRQSEQESPLPALHPAMAEIYRQKVTDLAAALNAPETRGEAAEILRGLIDTIELRPSAEAYDILLRGDLAGILTLASNSKKPATGRVTGFRKWRWSRRQDLTLPNQWAFAYTTRPAIQEKGRRSRLEGVSEA